MLDFEYVFDIIRFLAEWVRECHEENMHGTLNLSVFTPAVVGITHTHSYQRWSTIALSQTLLCKRPSRRTTH